MKHAAIATGGLLTASVLAGSLLLASPSTASTAVDTPQVLDTATSSSTIVSNEDEAATRAFWQKYGVDQATQDTLMKKLKRGERTDASSFADPERTEDIDINGMRQAVAFYADGSITVVGTEIPEPTSIGQMGTRGVGISGCSTTSGAGWATYKNCKVNVSSDSITMNFRATYERYSGAAGKILSTSSPAASSRNGTKITSAPKRIRFVKVAGKYQDAVATYRTGLVSHNNNYSETIDLSIRVPYSGPARATKF